jgi:hypothetical protein
MLISRLSLVPKKPAVWTLSASGEERHKRGEGRGGEGVGFNASNLRENDSK